MIKRFCFLTIAVMVLVAPATARAEGKDGPRDTLLLFVAAWCAPCRGELQQIDAISRAASPRNVLIVPLDGGRRTDAMLRNIEPRRIWRPTSVELKALQDAFFRDNAGLPFSAMTDEWGKACATNRSPLDAAKVGVMAASCMARVR